LILLRKTAIKAVIYPGEVVRPGVLLIEANRRGEKVKTYFIKKGVGYLP